MSVFCPLLRRQVVVFLTACLCLANLSVVAATAIQLPRNPAKPTEVVIIGTMHSAQLEYEDHAPARFRTLLNRIAPAAIGVETSPWWYELGIFFESAYESYGVAVPWAEEKGKEVRPIDWQAQGIEFVNALSWPYVPSDPGSSDSSESVSLDPWNVQELLFADTLEWTDEINRQYAYSTLDPNPVSEAMRRYMLYRNLMIARQILNLAADYGGQRVVIIIGAAHKPDLDLLLGSVPNIVIRHASEWGTVTEEEVAAEERRPDHLAILWFNMASGRVEPDYVDMTRMDSLLTGLEKETSDDPVVRFLRARWHELKGETDQALMIYRHLAWEAQWTDRFFTYPDRDLALRVHYWNDMERRELIGGEPAELALGTVLSPAANLTVRQRILYELARQEIVLSAQQRARDELMDADLNATQIQQLRELLSLTPNSP